MEVCFTMSGPPWGILSCFLWAIKWEQAGGEVYGHLMVAGSHLPERDVKPASRVAQ